MSERNVRIYQIFCFYQQSVPFSIANLRRKTVFPAWISRNVLQTMTYLLICERFIENVFTTKVVLENKVPHFYLGNTHG